MRGRRAGPIELKPHNNAAVARGMNQLRRYQASATAQGQLWTYRPRRILGGYKFTRVL